MPNDLLPWPAVCQQTQRWLAAGCFEALIDDLRMVLRLASGRNPEPSAAIIDSRTRCWTPESGERGGYDGAKRKKGSKRHIAVDTLGHPFLQALQRYERYAQTLAGLHLVAFATIMSKQAVALITGS